MTANNAYKRFRDHEPKPQKQTFIVDLGRLVDKELYHKTTVEDSKGVFLKSFMRDPWSEVIIKLTVDNITGETTAETVKVSDRREDKYRNVGE